MTVSSDILMTVHIAADVLRRAGGRHVRHGAYATETARRRRGQADTRRVADLPLFAWRPQHHRHLGHEARCASRVPRRVQTDRHQRQRRPGLRTSAAPGEADGQVLARPFVSPSQLGSRTRRPLHAHRLLPADVPGSIPRSSRTISEPLTAPSSPKKLGPPRFRAALQVCLPKLHPSGGSAYRMPAASPRSSSTRIPNALDFAVLDIVPLPALRSRNGSVTARDLLAQLDRFQQMPRPAPNKDAQTVGVFRRKAFELMTSADAKKAFDIHAESDKLRDEYGHNSLGPIVSDSRGSWCKPARGTRHHRPQRITTHTTAISRHSRRRCCRGPRRRTTPVDAACDLSDQRPARLRTLLDRDRRVRSHLAHQQKTLAAITGGRRSPSAWPVAAESRAEWLSAARRTPAERPASDP